MEAKLSFIHFGVFNTFVGEEFPNSLNFRDKFVFEIKIWVTPIWLLDTSFGGS